MVVLHPVAEGPPLCGYFITNYGVRSVLISHNRSNIHQSYSAQLTNYVLVGWKLVASHLEFGAKFSRRAATRWNSSRCVFWNHPAQPTQLTN
jgi:hypothetical protein